jgi:UDP-N-acetylglucosamine diphosphorylase / glucose-1-phosphate thymidylyltransferase / UDP-N-acetylgalactosamine diphosphorylase / glucosamine-1-phosphate N-acetyltransferase / galactosamine-1-phosphate N-acetyltransferase
MINRIHFFESIPSILTPWFPEDKPLWNILSHIKEAIYAIVNASPGKYNEIKKEVFTGENVIIDKCVEIKGPALIGKNSLLRHGALLRENVIINDNCLVGNSTELKNSVLFKHVQVPHFNYIGDSILGNYSHLGAGAKISNVLLIKNKKEIIKQQETAKEKLSKEIKIKNTDGNWINTGLKKFGAIIGDYAEIGVNATLNPGTLLEMGIFVPSSVSIGGYFNSDFTFPRNIIYECQTSRKQ